jgi:hypothetical protein
MGDACSKHGKDKCKVLDGKPGGKKPVKKA